MESSGRSEIAPDSKARAYSCRSDRFDPSGICSRPTRRRSGEERRLRGRASPRPPRNGRAAVVESSTDEVPASDSPSGARRGRATCSASPPSSRRGAGRLLPRPLLGDGDRPGDDGRDPRLARRGRAHRGRHPAAERRPVHRRVVRRRMPLHRRAPSPAASTASRPSTGPSAPSTVPRRATSAAAGRTEGADAARHRACAP